MKEKKWKNIVAKFEKKMADNKKSNHQSQIRSEMIKWNMCPDCGGDMTVTWRKWYQMYKPWGIRKCNGCSKTYKIHHTSLHPTGPR